MGKERAASRASTFYYDRGGEKRSFREGKNFIERGVKKFGTGRHAQRARVSGVTVVCFFLLSIYVTFFDGSENWISNSGIVGNISYFNFAVYISKIL